MLINEWRTGGIIAGVVAALVLMGITANAQNLGTRQTNRVQPPPARTAAAGTVQNQRITVKGGNAEGKKNIPETNWVKKGKNWKFGVRTFYFYDDNVVQAPDQDMYKPVGMSRKEGDTVFNGGVFGQYKFKINKKLSVGAEYDFDTQIHFDLSDYDLATHMFSLRPQYKITPLMNIDLRYMYIYNIANTHRFSGSHYISPSFNYMSRTFGLTRISYTFKTADNFQDNARDNNQHAFGIGQYIFLNLFSKLKGRVDLEYKFTTDDTKSLNYDRNLHYFGVKAQTPLFYGIKLQAYGKLWLIDYDHFPAASETREDTRATYGVRLSKVLLKKWKHLSKLSVEMGYQHTENNTNVYYRDYTSNRYEAKLRANF